MTDLTPEGLDEVGRCIDDAEKWLDESAPGHSKACAEITLARATLAAMREMTERNKIMRGALSDAAKQFRCYEEAHLAITPPSYAKADINAIYARMCEFALGISAPQEPADAS